MFRIVELVNKQSKDERLWFKAETLPEIYLQEQLRELHALIEKELQVEKCINVLNKYSLL